MYPKITEEIRKALDAATNGAEWTNFDDLRCEEIKLVGEYDRLRETMGKIIVECQSVEVSHFIANAPTLLRSLLEENLTLKEEIKRLKGGEVHES